MSFLPNILAILCVLTACGHKSAPESTKPEATEGPDAPPSKKGETVTDGSIWVPHNDYYASTVLRMSRALLAVNMERTINESSPLQEYVRDILVIGSQQVNGKININLHDNPSVAEFDVIFNGCSVSQAQAQQVAGLFKTQLAVVDSVAQVNLQAWKPVQFSEAGFATLPAQSQATAGLTIQNVVLLNSNGQPALLGQKTAWKKALEKQPEFEQEAARKGALLASARLDQDVGRELAKANARYRKKFYDSVIAGGQLPGSLHTSSSRAGIYVRSIQKQTTKLRNAEQPPLQAEDADLSFAMHESLLTAKLAKKWRGKKVPVSELKSELNKLFERKSSPPSASDDADAEIAFPAEGDPVEFRFEAGMMEIFIRSAGYYTAGVRQPALDVRVKYEMRFTAAGKIAGERDGKIIVTVPGGRTQMSSRERDLKAKLIKRYGEQLEQTFVADVFDNFGLFENQEFEPGSLTVQNGWLGVTWYKRS